MLQHYPKKVQLKDDVSCNLRPMVSDDLEALYRFFVSLPEADLRYLRDDPTDRRLVERWCREINYEKVSCTRKRTLGIYKQAVRHEPAREKGTLQPVGTEHFCSVARCR